MSDQPKPDLRKVAEAVVDRLVQTTWQDDAVAIVEEILRQHLEEKP